MAAPQKSSKQAKTPGNAQGKKHPSKRLGKKVLQAAVAVLLLAGVGYAGWRFWPVTAPDPEGLSETELVTTIATVDFSRLSPEQRAAYAQRLMADDVDRRAMFRQGHDLPEAERQQARQNMREIMQAGMNQRMNEYFQLTTQAQKNAYLDKMIDEMQKRRAEWEQRRQNRPQEERPPAEARTDNPSADENANRRGGGGRHTPSPERVKTRIENRDPYEHAQRMQFFEDMRKRMTERGITPPQRGPGGGPRG